MKNSSRSNQAHEGSWKHKKINEILFKNTHKGELIEDKKLPTTCEKEC